MKSVSPWMHAKMLKIPTSKKQLDLLMSKWVVEIAGNLYGPIDFDKIEHYESIGKITMLRPVSKRILDLVIAQARRYDRSIT